MIKRRLLLLASIASIVGATGISPVVLAQTPEPPDSSPNMDERPKAKHTKKKGKKKKPHDDERPEGERKHRKKHPKKEREPGLSRDKDGGVSLTY